MAGYDPNKAAEYNRLIQQGVAPEAAILQVGITYEERGNYEINSVGNTETNNSYGKMSDIAIPKNNTSGVNPASDPSQFPAYDNDGNLEFGFKINEENGQPYYAGVGPATQDTPVNPAIDPSQFPAYDDEGTLRLGFAINEENGQPYYRGVDPATRDVEVSPQSDPSQFPAYDDEGTLRLGFAINEENGQPYYRGVGPPTQQTAGFDPNYDEFGDLDAAAARQVESTSASTVNDPYYGLSPTQLQDLGGADPTDPYIRARLGIPQLPGSTLFATGGFGTIKTGVPAIDSALGIIGKIPSLFSNFANTVGGLFGPKPTATAVASTTGMSVAGLTTPTPTPPTTDTPVNPASDPSQFPAYDNEGNLEPGFAINEENGQPYYKGIEPATQDTPVNPASDPSQFPAYDNEGNLEPGFAINEEDGQPYYQGFERNTDQPVNPASDPSQFPAYDDDGTLRLGFAINDETGQPYYRGEGPPTQNTEVSNTGISVQLPGGALQFSSQEQLTAWQENPQSFAVQNVGGVNTVVPFTGETGTTDAAVSSPTDYGTTYDEFGTVVPKGPPTGSDTTTLNAEQADAFYNGTDTPTAAQQAATNAQTSADAAALYPGTNNTNLKNINDASAAIAQNEAGIANAQDIIAQNNAELADPDISDERRAELEANNAAQENYIRLAESNTGENELIIEANADSFAAGGGEPDSGQGPLEVAALEDPGLDTPVEEEVLPTEENLEVDPDIDAELQEPPGADVEFAALAEPVDPDADPELLGGPEEEVDPFTELAEPVDPDADPELLGGPEEEAEFTELAEPVDPDADPELLGGPEEDAEVTELAEPVDPDADPELLGGPDQEVDPFEPLTEPPDVDAAESPELLGGPGDEEPDEPELLGGPEDVDTAEDDGLKTPDGQEEAGGAADTGLREPTDADVEQANQEAAVRDRARQQATFQARYKQPGNADWRVRLSLAPDAQYLYNEKSGVGILAPLAKTDGVIFPYTPNITTTYSAQYEQYDLVHSNYRGLFYKNSRVGDIQVRGTFTAQDTNEADYLLAVIHFFRSATKMFYGATDPQRGVPPPVCLLNGFGQYQFSDHPVVISSFNYTLPNDVDYIRAGSPNNYGINLLNRRAAVASNPGGQSLAGLNRLANALLKKGAPGQGVPDPSAIQQNVSNTAGASYVPTKMEIDITLIPVQTRSQVSKQFSLKGFANGQLLKGGFW
jgi:hypothetical protein